MKRFILLCVSMCIVLTGCGSKSLSDNKGEEEISPTASLTPTEAGKSEEEAKIMLL